MSGLWAEGADSQGTWEGEHPLSEMRDGLHKEKLKKEEIFHEKKFWRKAPYLSQPVLIIASYDEAGVPDAMNAAWGGISEANEISMCLSAGHKTVKNILGRKAFTVSMADAAHVEACDYVGIESANKVRISWRRQALLSQRASGWTLPLSMSWRSAWSAGW